MNKTPQYKIGNFGSRITDHGLQKLIMLVLISVFTVSMVSAQQMTLEQCRNKAVNYNKQLKKAGLQEKEAIVQKKVAFTAYLPAFSADANYMQLFNSEEINMMGTPFTIENLSVAYGGISVSQPLYTGGKIMAANNMGEAGIAIAQYAYDLKYSEVIELTDKAFWNVAMVEVNIELAEKYIEMLTELEEQITAMYDVGLQLASEKLKVSVQKNEADLQLMRIRNNLKLAKMNLNQVIGQDLESEIQISYGPMNDLQLFDLSNGEKLAQKNRSELKILEEKIKMAEYDKKMINADYLPQLGVGFNYQGSWVKDYREKISFNPTIAAQLTIPIFQWRQGHHKRSAADYRTKQAITDLNDTHDMINLEVLQVKVKVEESYEAIIIATKNIGEAEESLEETQASFDVGLNSTTDLLNSQADWLNARVQRVVAIANYKVLETSWLKVTGRINPVE